MALPRSGGAEKEPWFLPSHILFSWNKKAKHFNNYARKLGLEKDIETQQSLFTETSFVTDKTWDKIPVPRQWNFYKAEQDERSH